MKNPNTYVAPLLLFFLYAFPFGKRATAQTPLAIGQWKEHLPFSAGLHVTQSADKVYYATRYAVLEVDKEEGSLRRLTKVEGLSDVGVSLVKYSEGSQTLVVVFDNGVVDLVRPDGILSLPAIRDFQTVGAKTIHEVYLANDSIAYFAASYGITTLNLRQGTFPNTIKTPTAVHAVRPLGGKLYAATDDGLYMGDPLAGYNLNDFSNWEWLNGTGGLPAGFSSKAMALFNGKLYLDVNDNIYAFDGQQAQYVLHHDMFELRYLTAEGRHLLAGFYCGPNCTGRTYRIDESHQAQPVGSDCVIFPLYAIEEPAAPGQAGKIWFADERRGFFSQAPGASTCSSFNVNSPHTINAYQVETANGQLWVAAGGLNLTFSALFRTDGIFSLIDGNWSVFNLSNTPELAGISDFLDVRVHPANGKVYAAAYLDALVEYDPATKAFKVFNENNSSLQTHTIDTGRSRVSGLTFDADNNLWICNNGAPRPLSVLTSTGEWQSFELKCISDFQILRVVVDALGYKWIMSTNNSLGVIVFDEGDLANPSDDRCKVFNSANSVLPTNEITSIEADRDGSIWVGTKLGAAVFQCDAFGEGGCPGSRPFVTVDGFGANLLEDTEVRAIAVDGANRKWFGTSAGIFVMSPEGKVQIAHFTAQNSPLFDNSINDIDFDDATGEAFIATARGLISLRAEATTATSLHSNVLVFPNPVREDYDGPIAIKGLAEDSTVKITDTAGQLVFETQALGGQAIWHGRDYTGRRANTGVYLVYATNRNANNPLVTVAKILVVR